MKNLKNRLFYALFYFLFWIIYFVFARLFFLLYYYDKAQELGFLTTLKTFFYGIQLDASFAAYLCLIPFVLLLLSVFINPKKIEEAIKNCKKCIVILSKNFLSNEGWGKLEFESIFIRDLVDRGGILIPVWVDVTAKEIYDYCPKLRVIRAEIWESNPAKIATAMKRAIRP